MFFFFNIQIIFRENTTQKYTLRKLEFWILSPWVWQQMIQSTKQEPQHNNCIKENTVLNVCRACIPQWNRKAIFQNMAFHFSKCVHCHSWYKFVEFLLHTSQAYSIQLHGRLDKVIFFLPLLVLRVIFYYWFITCNTVYFSY